MSNLSYTTKRNIVLFSASALLTPHLLPIIVLAVWLTALFASGALLTAAAVHCWESGEIQSLCSSAVWEIRNAWVYMEPANGAFWISGLGGRLLSLIEGDSQNIRYF